MDNQLTVSKTADAIGVSPDTIRRWDKRGLIRGVRSNLNHRLYNINEVKRLHDKFRGNGGKSHYKILKAKKKSKYKVIELFAGAGGTSLGFHNAGLQHELLNEFDKNAVETLKKNMPNFKIDENDIKDVNFKGYNADIVEGGFPCQSFSFAGKKLGFEDARGTLFFEFARCVKEVKPKIAMGENVKGLLRHDNGQTLKSMLSILRELGYKVAYKVLKSQYHDVPQKRERLIILAVRKDLKIPFLFPKEKDYIVSIKEALINCPKSDGQLYPEKKKKILKLVPPGGCWRNLPKKIQKEYMGASYFMGGGKTGMARRLSWEEPSLTLTCAPAQKQTERCHPEETRPLTVREYARIQTFPDNWDFIGSTCSQYKQIGNAVPVNLGYHIGKCLIAMLDNKPDYNNMEEVKETEQLNLL